MGEYRTAMKKINIMTTIPSHNLQLRMVSIQVGREEYRGLHGLKKSYDLIVVGAGLSGAVVAERASKLLGLRYRLAKYFMGLSFYNFCNF